MAAAGAGSTLSGEGVTRQAPAVSKGRVIGANDRINVGFVGCGGRMNAHIRRVMERNKERGDVQAVAVNDIWDKRKQRAREATGVDERSVYHDYREVCARPDVDVVVIASPDHWHHLQTMDALRNGKDVYLEKPMTYTVDEAREVAEAVKSSGRVLQVGSQYTSMDHFWKAKQAIKDGLLGEVVWASGGFGRNRNLRGEWNYAIDPEATEKTLDWKAFLGPAPKRAFDPERYFRWRKYWDYSGGIATDLFYHTFRRSSSRSAATSRFRVTSSGGIYVQKDREVPDTFFMNVDYPAWTMQLACSVASGAGAPLVIHGSQATLFIGQNSENLVNTQMEVVPDAEYRDEFVKKTGGRDAQDRSAAGRARRPSAHGQLPRVRPFASGAEPAGEAWLPGDGRDRHGRAGLSPARGAVLRSPAREGLQQADRDVVPGLFGRRVRARAREHVKNRQPQHHRQADRHVHEGQQRGREIEQRARGVGARYRTHRVVRDVRRDQPPISGGVPPHQEIEHRRDGEASAVKRDTHRPLVAVGEMLSHDRRWKRQEGDAQQEEQVQRDEPVIDAIDRAS